MLRVGIVGLPNAGKSTTFNAISGAEAVVAPYPFSTIEPNKAVVGLHDPDLEELASSVEAADIQYSNLEIMDIAGLIKGASNGEGLGNEFLGQMKNCDMLIHLVRVAKGSDIDVIRENIDTVRQEIAFFDHRLLRKPFEKARRLARLYPKSKEYRDMSKLYTTVFYKTQDGDPISQVATPAQIEALEQDEIGLVSLKPSIIIANVDSDDGAKNLALELGADLVVNSYELSEMAGLSAEEQKELGFSGTELKVALEGLTRVVLAATAMKQVYTIGHLGVGQWVAPDQATAEYCASLLHKDLEEETKSVKVAQPHDFMVHKTWSALAKNGLVKTYGASKYVPKDKEILLFE